MKRHPASRLAAALGARWLATAEVILMLVLGAFGRGGDVVRMLLAVGTIYAASEGLGRAWRRERPFARLADIERLLAHRPERSFPSRHVASALAMAAIGSRSHRGLGRAMAWLGWLLGISRVAAGLHYPSDVLTGAMLGALVGWLLRAPDQ
jgi:undecaprenyl-diphosphatase